jgi:hypothetical protein
VEVLLHGIYSGSLVQVHDLESLCGTEKEPQLYKSDVFRMYCMKVILCLFSPACTKSTDRNIGELQSEEGSTLCLCCQHSASRSRQRSDKATATLHSKCTILTDIASDGGRWHRPRGTRNLDTAAAEQQMSSIGPSHALQTVVIKA